MIFGALNLRTGHRVLLARPRQRSEDFCAFLRALRRCYRDRPLALLLDEDPSHTAVASQRLAARLSIRMLWLPKRSPELNPVEHLWRAAKQDVCANRQYATIDREVSLFIAYLRGLTNRAALRKAGVLSRHFRLRFALSKRNRRPTLAGWLRSGSRCWVRCSVDPAQELRCAT